MRKFAIGTAILTLISGIVGYELRHLYLTRAIESDTGLPVYSSPSFIAMAAYAAFIVVLALVLAYFVRRFFNSREVYREVIGPVNTLYMCCMSAVYILLLASGAIGLMRSLSGGNADYVLLIRAISVILTCVSLFGLTFQASKKKDFGGSLVFSIIPEVAITFWLLVFYRSNQTNPVLTSYVYFALALAASAFAFYFTAGYVYGRCAPLRFVFSHAIAIYFLIMSLADDIPLTEKLCFAGLALFFIVNLARFVGNLQKKKKNETEAPPEVISEGT